VCQRLRIHSVDLTNSLASYYQAPFARGKPDPCIHPNGGILTIGYGLGGALPFGYGLSDEQNIDVGSVKVFLSTENVDLSIIPQPSPFDSDRYGIKSIKRHVGWHTMLFTVVKRRYPKTILSEDSLEASFRTPEDAEEVRRWNLNLTGTFKEPEKGSLGATVDVESDSPYPHTL
jgi:hypothetical protein